MSLWGLCELQGKEIVHVRWSFNVIKGFLHLSISGSVHFCDQLPAVGHCQSMPVQMQQMDTVERESVCVCE